MENKWSIQDSLEQYLVSRWGKPYFSINDKGHLLCTPKQNSAEGIDLKELIDDLKKRGIKTPLLIRFNDILASQVEKLSNSFNKSIDCYNYLGTYQTVMPPKLFLI